jgi:chemotaxis protein MotA
LGIIAVVGGMIAKGANPAALLNPAAIIIILVGTVAAICNAFSLKELKQVPALFRIVFTNQKSYEPMELIDLIVDIASQARKEGLLSLEGRIAEIDDPFIKKGLH